MLKKKIIQPPPRHDHQPLKFPEGFLWGAATSSHQVEGNNKNNDWWEWEQTRPEKMRSGLAADQYNRYAEDFSLAKKLGHNAHRLSIEWSRIEPEPGWFNQEEIDHYVDVLKDLKSKGFTVMLTLHHFTNPLWLSKVGAWENSKTPVYFNNFVAKVVPIFKDYVDLWITINEPGVLVFCDYVLTKWPPQKKSKLALLKATKNLARAHKMAYTTIHELVPNAQVGFANNVSSFESFHKHSIREKAYEWFLDIITDHLFYKATGMEYHDFLGVNYYFNEYISFNGNARLPNIVDIATTKKATSDLGWEIYPEGIFNVLVDLSDYHKPIYITENGLASTNDDRRCRFLISYLQQIYHAMASGCHVKGYFHWSLLDNFEWSDGFDPRFGLIEVDYETQKRTPRPSAYVYQKVIEANGIPHELLKFLGHSIDAKDVLKDL